jgi:phosphoesterase RecJ-like protein
VNITQKDLAAVNQKDVSDVGLVSLLNQINEGMIAVFFFELAGANRVKLSMRSKRGYDVGTIAQNIGGGGHTQASGPTVDGTLQDVRNRIIPMLKQAVQDGELIIA